MKKKLAFMLVAVLISAGLLVLVGNAVADMGIFAKAATCIKINTRSMNNISNYIISLSSNPMTSYSEDMKFDDVRRKLIDAKNKGLVGNERHFFDKRALERSIAPRDIGEVVDSCEVLEEQIQKAYPKLHYKIKGMTGSGRELILIVAITKDGYLYVKTGWEI